MTEFFCPTARDHRPVDVEMTLSGRPAGGKSTLAKALWAASKAGHLPGIKLCFDPGLAAHMLQQGSSYPDMKHPLYVGLSETDGVPAGDPPLDVQVQELAEFIQGNFPGMVGPGGAIDSAIRLINAQAAEIRAIDSLLARRQALEGAGTRVDKIGLALRTAGEVEALRAHVANLRAYSEGQDKLKADLADARAERDKFKALAQEALEERDKAQAGLAENLQRYNETRARWNAQVEALSNDAAKLCVERDQAREELALARAANINVTVSAPNRSPEAVDAVLQSIKAGPQRHPHADGPPSAGSQSPEVTVAVYADDGRVFEYKVANAAKAREHTHAIVMTGYRHSSADEPGVLEHYGPARILKVKVTGPGITTLYTDNTRGT